MRLTERQAESLEILYSNAVNALIYAEDMFRDGNNDVKHLVNPIVIKLKWIKSDIESKIPPSRRESVRGQDTLYYDALLRAVTSMTEQQKELLEEFINKL